MVKLPYYRIIKTHNFADKQTITGYPHKQAFERLSQALLGNETHKVVYWLSEILGSNLIEELWLHVFDFYVMYVHIYYPNFLLYINEKYHDYMKLKITVRHEEFKNNLKTREYMFRIYYIFSTIHKRYIVDLFKHADLFPSFRKTFDKHKHLLRIRDTPIQFNVDNKSANEIIEFVNKKSSKTIENAIHHFNSHFDDFVKNYQFGDNKSKYLIYTWLSFLLERGIERFDLYVDRTYVHLSHCKNENKYSYFIWMMWNTLLKNIKGIEIREEIRILYKLYDNHIRSQSLPAYFIIICAFVFYLEKVERKKIYIDDRKYNKMKTKFYKAFGFLGESVERNQPRRDGY